MRVTDFTSMFHENGFIFVAEAKDPSGAKVEYGSNAKHVSGSKKQVDRYEKRESLKNRTKNIIGNDRKASEKGNDKYTSPYNSSTGRKGVNRATYSRNGGPSTPMPGVKESAELGFEII